MPRYNVNGIPRILVVEDEAAIRQMIAFNLTRAGYEVDEAEDCTAARNCIADAKPDLVLVDWMLPDASGLELTRALRRDEVNMGLPIIMLTAKADERDKLMGLDSGADDYITKPFSPRELVSRIKALLRRAAPVADEPLNAGILTLDPVSHRVAVEGSELNLGPDRIPAAEVPDAESRARVQPQPAAGLHLGSERVCRGTNRRRPRSPTAKDARTLRSGQYIQTVRGAGYRFSTR